MKFSIGFLFILGAVLVSSCMPVSTLTVHNPPDIIVNANNNHVAITAPPGARCKARNRVNPGCVHFDTNETGTLTFKRTGQKTWTFTKLQICKLNADGTKDCNRDSWERMQFAASDTQKNKLVLPDKNGVFDLSQLLSVQSEFLLLNLNTVDQDYYYQVELCQSGVNCEWADPPIENKGRK